MEFFYILEFIGMIGFKIGEEVRVMVFLSVILGVILGVICLMGNFYNIYY